MTVSLRKDGAAADRVEDTEPAESTEPTGQLPAWLPASWPARAGAFAVDVFFGTGVVISCALVAQSASISGLGWLRWTAIAVAGAVFLAMAVNRLLLPSITGWTLGRLLAGITVVSRDGAPIGPWRLLIRDLAHLLDTAALFLGWLWPLWDSRGRTFADLLTRTEVHRTDGDRPNRRRLAGGVLAVLAALAVAATALSYFLVYRPELAVQQAREQLAVQGPKTVQEMLSYSLASTDADFARARGLVTDAYRPTLVADQDRARKLGLSDTEYWVVNSSVLTNSRDRAEMLMFMQGQRGEAPKLRLITATVQVKFERAADGQWKVADFSVLAKPGGPK
ncbi:Mce-associated membrane protein [Mycolicibacterium sp. BK556]|uniref:RDD family protein n=1 Tax=Mycobacteriaceae TaxID=1762 RepID=UPI001060A288|nr:RDD family protein [Mycobacterium sp. BK086]MBB3600806.1 Mce-associated membrane protein [Mycolicibacterium sp. BK556]MBB3630560.1 Mce-associated membrane protein [Mycolicibacterium sp. BK607]TDO10348.1 Mce-associated membrane protein [Mycobacterium sp. BK086]